MSTVHRLTEKKLISPPSFLPTNIQYETMMGSVAYGCNREDADKPSDTDVYGFCIPPKSMIFPHLDGHIEGFGRQIKRFEQWQEHHVFDKDALSGKGKVYDFQIFNIVKYFQLLMDNNPNIIDSIFTPRDCVLHCTAVGNLVRDNRKVFLHKGLYHKFRGYAFAQLNKIGHNEHADPKGNRYADIQKYGWDLKYGYHLVRLLNECRQILETGDLDLRRDREIYKSIRRGEWTEKDIREYFTREENSLAKLYETSALAYGPDESKIKNLLLECLEHHYGSLANAIVLPTQERDLLLQIKKLCEKVV